MAHTDEVTKIQESLDAWTKMWELFVEPIFESVYDYDMEEGSLGFMKLTGELSHHKRQQWQPEIPRFTAPNTLKLPKPIINVGFPKAGTSSLFSFFHCNGLKGQHWFCCEPQHHPAGTEHQHLMSRCILENIMENHDRFQHNLSRPRKHLLEGCGDYDFYSEINGPRMFQSHHFRILEDDGTFLTRTQSKREPRLILPQHHYLEELHQQFPNATFILNLRPTQEWVNSVMRWGTTLRQEIPNEFLAQDHKRGFSTFHDHATLQRYGVTHIPPQTVSDLNSTLAYIMDYHSNYVRDFVRRHPSHTLIEVDITRYDTGQRLADAFGLNETCWEHRNQNKKGNQSYLDLSDLQLHKFLEEASTEKIRLRQQVARKKRAEMSGGMLQMFSAVTRNVNSPEELPMEASEFEPVRISKGAPLQENINSHEQSLGEVPAFRFAASAGDELEIYDVGDSSTEARLARKELYQKRLKQIQ